VVDTLSDFDNVLYEIANETHPGSTDWQYHMIRFIRRLEQTKPRQHPVGMTFQFQGGANATLFASPADWISPNPEAEKGHNYRDDPPPADGRKVILSDTDHLWGIGGSLQWVWKSFLRGLNPLFMDPYRNDVLNYGPREQWEPLRRSLGNTRRFAERMDLLAMTPRPELASTGYCLAQPGVEYLVYAPDAPKVFSVDLKAGKYQYEWFDPVKGARAATGHVESRGGAQQFNVPFEGEAVLYLKAQ
jgi:hypothetical protein